MLRSNKLFINKTPFKTVAVNYPNFRALVNSIASGGIRAVEVSESVEVPVTKAMCGRDTSPPDLRGLLSFKQPG